MQIDRSQIDQMEKLYRVNLVNSITGFKSANLIGTVGPKGSNLAIFSSVTHFGSNPPTIGLVSRPTVVDRHTFQNIKRSGEFTVNHISVDQIKSAHQTSARYPENVSEFDKCGFTQEYSSSVRAPYVKESVVKFGVKFVEEHHIEFNGTVLLIGEIIELFVGDNMLDKDGRLDLESSRTVTIGALDSYFHPKKLATFPYAKP